MLKHLYPSADEYENEMKRKFENHAVFRAKNGYLGIGSPHLKKGDYILLPAGARVPYAVRGYDPANESVQLLGEAYVHGIMNGELLDDRDWWRPQLVCLR
jgi:hypothetical protein